jgi:hypothetical protein
MGGFCFLFFVFVFFQFCDVAKLAIIYNKDLAKFDYMKIIFLMKNHSHFWLHARTQ